MKRQAGFSLIELVIVVVVLGLLAAVALPRFIDITEQAEDAASEGVAGGLASAVGITRAQWEVEGRPDNRVILDGKRVSVNEFGYPAGTNGRKPNAMVADDCLSLFNDVLQSPPPAALSSANLSDVRYAVDVLKGNGGAVIGTNGSNLYDNTDLCIYTQVGTLQLEGNGTTNQTLRTDVGKGFTYEPGSGQVVTFSN
ncbi:prepilin-type N-terminal cleavage/methylation domain-containing protein [Ferrimonas sediminicola]|uniref:Prepilin-type N-terminal cleavage/methylation domain-containing protein n=1 Tax=Ferrimonas sediminicola TaxID=2569538 RepID=A0A4U1BID7_9GAMM|nr:prepilin-type N-terminal cleavage/methylation domain-containing protein [Ferrimonas sediminicola]TKB51210.1 prepilin-type N-terminal cleavage/methylation domain-containing protein [Ferrimonas sediminicola]